MKKVLIVPDSFKGTLSSEQICSVIKERVKYHFPKAEVISLPVADGGEGTVDSFLSSVGGELVKCRSVNPFFEDVESFWGLINNGRTAVIEMAAAAGLPLVENKKQPMKATTYGVGLLIKDAAERGVKEVILGLGGSATNDFGCGAASALGVAFFNKDGKAFIPTGATLSEVAGIDLSGIDEKIKKIKIKIMCDVKNTVYGPSGAAYVYAPQKGASPSEVELLDNGLRNICDVVRRDVGKDVSMLVGGGAAGAMAAGMVSFFGAGLEMGIDTVLDTVGFEALLADADIVFTGEGKIDSQSLSGKVVSGVAKRARNAGVPVVAIVGGVDGDIKEIYDIGVNSVFTINQMPEDLSTSRYKSEANLKATVDNLLRFLSTFSV